RKKFFPEPGKSLTNSVHPKHSMSTPSAIREDRWPPQTKFIIGNEAAERFSYYGLVSILMVYITGVLEQSKDEGTQIIHLFKFVNYFMPLLGAWVSDRYLGRY